MYYLILPVSIYAFLFQVYFSNFFLKIQCELHCVAQLYFMGNIQTNIISSIFVQSYFANTSAKLFSIVGSKNFKVDIGISSIFSKFQFSSQPINSTLEERTSTGVMFLKLKIRELNNSSNFHLLNQQSMHAEINRMQLNSFAVRARS